MCLGMALLAAEPFGLGDGDALQPDFVQGVPDLVQLERFDDRFDFFIACRARGKPGVSLMSCEEM